MNQAATKARGTKSQIDEFLAIKRIAIIGLSREQRSYSRSVARELRRRGRDLIGVNRNSKDIDGIPCVAEIAALPAGLDAALVILPPAQSDASVHACLDAGLQRIWVRGQEGRASVRAELAEQCVKLGVTLIDGHCPLMFLAGTGFPHSLHRRFAQWFGIYPR
ncbi:CoA-binding protein [candidate division KSB1 bacterium]|nr:CoA-binding protein [candidate division KSB1 bacterium]